MPLISIIVPVYNVEQYLERCVRSILTQSFSDFELILVDDGSPDNCGILCDQYAQEDSRVKVIHQNNAGLSAARNAGLDWFYSNSDSKWICFVDSDDWLYINFLQAMFHCANSNDADTVISEFIRTSGEEPIIEESSLKGKIINIEDFYINHNVTATIACGKLYCRKSFENVRYPVGKIHEDEYVTYKILFECNKVTYIDQPLYFYYQNPEGIMNRKWNPKRLDAVQAYEEQIDYFKKKKRVHVYLVKRYIYYLYDMLNKLNDNSEYKEYTMVLKSKLSRTLLKYKKIVDWETVPYAAELCFPRYMRVYWFVNIQLNKIRKKSR